MHPGKLTKLFDVGHENSQSSLSPKDTRLQSQSGAIEAWCTEIEIKVNTSNRFIMGFAATVLLKALSTYLCYSCSEILGILKKYVSSDASVQDLYVCVVKYVRNM